MCQCFLAWLIEQHETARTIFPHQSAPRRRRFFFYYCFFNATPRFAKERPSCSPSGSIVRAFALGLLRSRCEALFFHRSRRSAPRVERHSAPPVGSSSLEYLRSESSDLLRREGCRVREAHPSPESLGYPIRVYFIPGRIYLAPVFTHCNG